MKKLLLTGVLVGVLAVVAFPATGAQKAGKSVDLQMESPDLNTLNIKATSKSSKCVKNRTVKGTFTYSGDTQKIPTDIKLDKNGERVYGSNAGTYEGRLPAKTIKDVKCKPSPKVSVTIEGF